VEFSAKYYFGLHRVIDLLRNYFRIVNEDDRTTHSSGQKLAAGTRGHRCLNQSVGAADFSPTRLRDWWFGASKSGLFL
jgi:hypothetical protein